MKKVSVVVPSVDQIRNTRIKEHILKEKEVKKGEKNYKIKEYQQLLGQ